MPPAPLRSRLTRRDAALRRFTRLRYGPRGTLALHRHTIGAFEGANYEAKGYYRPQVDCVMFTRNEVPFCAVCRRALERVIDLYAR